MQGHSYQKISIVAAILIARKSASAWGRYKWECRLKDVAKNVSQLCTIICDPEGAVVANRRAIWMLGINFIKLRAIELERKPSAILRICAPHARIIASRAE